MKVSKLLTSIFLILLISVSIFSQKESEIKTDKSVSQCKVRLEVEFLMTGKIGDISLISSNCDDT